MSSLFSPVKKIDGLCFTPWNKVVTSRPRSVTIVRIDNLLLAKDDRGRLACSDLKNYAYCLGHWSFARKLMGALMAFKIITRAEANQHLEACTKHDISGEAKYDLEQFEKLVKKYGTAQHKLVNSYRVSIKRTIKTGSLQ